MSIIRRATRLETGFYLLANAIAQDRRLSWSARGVLVYLLSKPSSWTVSVANLQNETKGAVGRSTGRDGVYAILRELESVGYVRRMQPRLDDGSMGPMVYEVSEVPGSPLPEKPEADDGSPLTGSPEAGEPHTANPPLEKTDSKKGQREESTERLPCGRRRPSDEFWLPELEACGVERRVAASWLSARREKRLTNTALALEGIQTEAQKCGLTLNEALTVAASNGWAGFKAKWVQKDGCHGGGGAGDGRAISAVEGLQASLGGVVERGTLRRGDGDLWEADDAQ